MLKRLRVAAVALVLLVGSLAAAAPVAAAGNQYFQCNALDSTNTHIIVYKKLSDAQKVIPTAAYFSYGRGDPTIQRLYPCDNFLGTGGHSVVLPVNLEGASGHIYQLGYGADSFGSNDNRTMKFTYTPYGNVDAYDWPGTMQPFIGRRYRFSIAKVSVLFAWRGQVHDHGPDLRWLRERPRRMEHHLPAKPRVVWLRAPERT